MIGLTEPFTHKSVTYQLAPLSIADTEELAAWVKKRVADLIALARDAARDMPTDLAVPVLQHAIDDTCAGYGRLGTEEANAVLMTPEGFVEQLFLAGRKHQPNMVRQDWARIVDNLVSEAVAETAAAEDSGAVPSPRHKSKRKPAAKRTAKKDLDTHTD